jgi:pimeloyl-ACP methyl ester carboxylesterase
MNFYDVMRKKPSLAFFRVVDRSQRRGLAGSTPAASCGSFMWQKPSLAVLRFVALAVVTSAARADAPVADAGDAMRRDAALVDFVRRGREALEWTDEAVRHDWRLQRRPGTDACRVLDPDDQVICEGTGHSCRVAFDRLRPPAGRDEAVILLHGLGESRWSMQPLAESLRPALDADVMSFGYASVKADIDAHARALGAVVAGLPEAERISFVGHSLGNLVVRRWMAIAAAEDLARVRRMVMLGPPNQGADLARLAAKIWGLAARAEGAARDLVVNWDAVAPGLAVPPCDFGIVAGGKGDDVGYSPLLEGDDDAVVRVDETRLEGAADFLLVPVHHASMMRHERVQRATAVFLRDGRFPPGSAPAAAAEGSR